MGARMKLVTAICVILVLLAAGWVIYGGIEYASSGNLTAV
jgi:hypothetical protein